jgi:hypothetical protein
MTTPSEFVAVTPDEPEEPEVTWSCDCCESGMTADDESYSVVTGRDSRGRHQIREWCEQCYNDSAVYVEDGDYHASQDYAGDYLYYHESDGAYHEEPEENDDALYEYGTNVLRVHGWPSRTSRTGLCFGVELEMEAKRRALFEDMMECLGGKDGNGRYILKADGSLEDGQGAELVTLPYSLEDHRTMFGWHKILSADLQRVAMSGAGTTNCGIHIHVNREALSALTVGKLLVFLNADENEGLVTTIAQRASNSMCERDAKKAKVSAVRSSETCRYDILNVTNGGTIEFRLFRGNLRPERVLKNIEFCHALIRFCEQTSIKDAADRFLFLGWLEKNAKNYPHLVAFLIEKRRITAPNPRSTANYAMLCRTATAEV